MVYRDFMKEQFLSALKHGLNYTCFQRPYTVSVGKDTRLPAWIHLPALELT